MRIKRINIIGAFAGLLAMGWLTACSESSLEDLHNGTFDNKSQIVLTFVTPNDGTSTRSATEDPDGYEAGIEYENTVNIDAGDYKMYFFSYESGDKNGGTLIAEFTPGSIKQSSTSTTTTYTVTGDVPEELKDVSNFRVVMLTNWGSYPSVTAGTTTIDDLVEGQYTTFNASSKFTIDADNLIPFYGVQEYSGVTFKEGTTTTLSTPVSLLRAVAKVEVILTEDSYVDAFDAVSIVNYNAQGYCAPWGVYTADDYNADYSIQPEDNDWPSVFVDGLHLVGGSNDSGSKTQAFTQITDATQDTWRIYVPEYSNSSDDYSYITLTINGEQFNVYFADYTDGETDNSDTSKRYNLKRNNLYRFYVTYKYNHIRVFVETWENVFDNEWKFGEYSHLIYSDSEPNYFEDENGYIYASLVKEGDVESEANPTVYLQKVSATTTGYVRIPETVTYMGYTYTVVGIGSYCFDADEGVTFIDIPATVTYIESEAFHGDIGLEVIAVHSEYPPTCATDAFEDDKLENVTLYVPTNAEETYKNTVWGEFGFKEIIGIGFTN